MIPLCPLRKHLTTNIDISISFFSGGTGSEKDARQAKPDETGEIRRHFLAEAEGASSARGPGEGRETGRHADSPFAATAMRRRGTVVHPHRETDTVRGRR